MLNIIKDESVVSLRRIPMWLVDATDRVTAETGVTFSGAEIQVSKNGATETDFAGTVTEVGGGLYYYQPSALEIDTYGFLTIRVVKTGIAQFVGLVQIVRDEVASILSQVADVTELGDEVAARLPNADAIWDEPTGDGTITARQALKVFLAALGGKVTGGATTTVNIRNIADTKNVIVATVDADGNRSAVTLDVS